MKESGIFGPRAGRAFDPSLRLSELQSQSERCITRDGHGRATARCADISTKGQPRESHHEHNVYTLETTSNLGR